MKPVFPLLASLMLISPVFGAETHTPESIRASVNKALPLLFKGMTGHAEKRDCFACHHQAVPLLAITSAKSRGFEIPKEVIDITLEHTEADLRSAIEDYKKGEGQGGGVTRAGYALFTLGVGGKKPDDVTNAVTSYLLKRDETRDHWRGSSNRPPSEASEFTSTYLAIRALSDYGQNDQREQTAARLAKAREWLAKAEPKDTEDRVFRLLAMKAAASPEASIRDATNNLLATIQKDGGWSQIDGAASDSYATGSVLFALHWAGNVPTDNEAFQKGISFLLGNQREDGSWFVASRSKPFQPYYESGFPHGKNQFISMAASAWAVTALSLALPEK